MGAGQAAVQRQQLELQLQQQQRAAAGLEAAGTGKRGGEAAAVQSASAEQGPRGATASESGSGCSDDSWERFHAQHSQARFFKEKRCLGVAMPALHVAEARNPYLICCTALLCISTPGLTLPCPARHHAQIPDARVSCAGGSAPPAAHCGDWVRVRLRWVPHTLAA